MTVPSTGTGEPAYLGVRQGLKAPILEVRKHSCQGGAASSSLCTGAASQSEGAHSRTLMGMEQSDSAQKRELHAICEGLQVYSLQVQTATLLTGTGGGRAELCSLENSRSALVNDFNEYIHCLNANIAAEVVSETIFCFPLMLFPFICYQIG